MNAVTGAGNNSNNSSNSNNQNSLPNFVSNLFGTNSSGSNNAVMQPATVSPLGSFGAPAGEPTSEVPANPAQVGGDTGTSSGGGDPLQSLFGVGGSDVFEEA
jgi:hypothetical protein